ncbi:MAG: CBS domain-containing protein, partial [Caldilineaceae bacterium]
MNIRDIMSAPPVTVLYTASVQEVALLMSGRQISGVPVVNEAGELMGLITELHLIARNAPVHEPRYIAVLSGLIPLNLEEHREYKERLREALATTAGELMDNTEIPIAAPEDPIDAAFDLLSTPEYTLLPIVEGEA